MKILLARVAYVHYLDQFAARQPDLAELDYAAQEARFAADGFDWWGLWAAGLRAAGHEAAEIAVNAPTLQAAWARAHGVSLTADWEEAVALAQVIAYAPDVLMLMDHHHFSPAWLAAVRAACPTLRLVTVWCSAPYTDTALFRAVDLVLSCSKPMVAGFRAAGLAAEHLHHGFGPELLARLQTGAAPHLPVTFVGQLTRGKAGHLEREQLLEAMVAAFPATQLFTPSSALAPWRDRRQTLLRRAAYLGVRGARGLGVPPTALARLPGLKRAAYWNAWPLPQVNPRLRPFCRPAVFGVAMLQTLRDSQVTLNTHIAITGNAACNMRLFEAGGVGACMVTDWKDDLATLYAPDQEIIAYRSLPEAVEQVRYLLDHPEAARALGAAAQVRTLREHRIDQRMAQLAALLTRAVK